MGSNYKPMENKMGHEVDYVLIDSIFVQRQQWQHASQALRGPGSACEWKNG